MELEARAVTKLIGISQNLLTQWIARGFVRASRPAHGSGSRNLFSAVDVCRIKLFKHLNSVGFTRSAAASVAFSSLTPDSDLIHKALSEQITEQEAVTRSGKGRGTLLTDPLSPNPVYFALVKEDKGIRGYRISDPEHFAELYRNMENCMSFHVINLNVIVNSVLSKIEEVHP